MHRGEPFAHLDARDARLNDDVDRQSHASLLQPAKRVRIDARRLARVDVGDVVHDEAVLLILGVLAEVLPEERIAPATGLVVPLAVGEARVEHGGRQHLGAQHIAFDLCEINGDELHPLPDPLASDVAGVADACRRKNELAFRERHGFADESEFVFNHGAARHEVKARLLRTGARGGDADRRHRCERCRFDHA